ncbi:hypothetical protein H0Z60_10180 [Ectothiorhodospiraceae bacterium WFHF3C12]|nr:hypothetical protein [Ectothiorhodospiraceae bacterium WFHF3C12]
MEQDIVLGAGKVFFDLFDANGAITGERYLGDTPGFRVSVNNESVQKWSSDGPTAELMEDVATRVTRECVIECENVNMDNLAAFLQGDTEDVAGGGGSVTAEAHTVQPDRYYQLGQGSGNPTGARDVSAVTVTGSGGTPSYTEGTDYTVDLALGRLYIIPEADGGTIVQDPATEADIEVDYTEGSTSRTRIASNDDGPIFGALRYVADNTRGKNRDLYATKVQLRPDGELAWKSRDTWQRLTFRAQFQKPDTGAALYVDGRAV